MERIMQEKISADHLLYVSLKYTKTTDVILNLLERWKIMTEIAVDQLLEKAKKKKAISVIPIAPKLKIDKVKELYKKNPVIMKTIEELEFFKRIERMEKVRENEFRKNVVLKLMDQGKWVSVDMDKLKEYSALLESFMTTLKTIL